MEKEMWIVIHWDNGILYRGNDKAKAFEIYEDEKKEEQRVYNEDNYETSGEEHITIYKAVKEFYGIPTHHTNEFKEISYIE